MSSQLPKISRRVFVAAAGSAAICTPALAQHAGHGVTLPEAKPSADPFSRLQGGTPHHLTTEQDRAAQDRQSRAKRAAGALNSQGCLASAAEARWRGRRRSPAGCISSAAMARDASTAPITMSTRIPRMIAGSTPRPCRAAPTMSPWWRMPAGSTRSAALSSRTAIPIPMRSSMTSAIRQMDDDCAIAAFVRRCGSGALDGKIHLIGGAGAPTMERASVGWHEVYDPTTDKWERVRKALPAARDHVGSGRP